MKCPNEQCGEEMVKPYEIWLSFVECIKRYVCPKCGTRVDITIYQSYMPNTIALGC